MPAETPFKSKQQLAQAVFFQLKVQNKLIRKRLIITKYPTHFKCRVLPIYLKSIFFNLLSHLYLSGIFVLSSSLKHDPKYMNILSLLFMSVSLTPNSLAPTSLVSEPAFQSTTSTFSSSLPSFVCPINLFLKRNKKLR